jgi:hypothetical protein
MNNTILEEANKLAKKIKALEQNIALIDTTPLTLTFYDSRGGYHVPATPSKTLMATVTTLLMAEKAAELEVLRAEYAKL